MLKSGNKKKPIRTSAECTSLIGLLWDGYEILFLKFSQKLL